MRIGRRDGRKLTADIVAVARRARVPTRKLHFTDHRGRFAEVTHGQARNGSVFRHHDGLRLASLPVSYLDDGRKSFARAPPDEHDVAGTKLLECRTHGLGPVALGSILFSMPKGMS